MVPVEFFPGLGRRRNVGFGDGFVREFVGVVGELLG